VPYYAAEDVEAALSQQGARFRKSKSCYQLRFPDTQDNRLKILRFLFGEYLREISPQRLLSEWDRYAQRGHIEVNTHSYHFSAEPA
jgi:trans-aconitate 2-methyltransferase